MFSIYKRELRGYFNSVIGYLVMAAMLLFIGVYYIFINLTYGYASFAVSLYSTAFIFIVVIPILTMRSMAEDRKNKTDQLLLTSPVSVNSIIWGKYLSMVTVFGLVCLISCIFPLLLRSLGSTKMLVSYSMILAFFLFGCAAISIGLYISCKTENQILACVGTMAVLLILELMQSLSSLIPGSGTISNGIQNFLDYLCLSSHLDQFYNEIFDVTAIVFYLSVIFVFLFLSVQSVEKRRWSH